ncbi:MAG: T9SS type A sorting domain-containing protein [Chitinophagaceae bacterium]|nr:T9SS type A sorting domain-containing protein [Chitinophagaceae bacterium]
MKKYFLIAAILSVASITYSQVLKTNGNAAKKGEINIHDIKNIDVNAQITNVDLHPLPSAAYGNLKAIRKAQRKQLQAPNIPFKKTRGNAINPIQTKGVFGNSGGIPLDNDIAVSNNGLVLTCVNSNIRIFNDTFKTIVASKSLTSLVAQLGVYNWISDPRAIYDPVAERFIMTFFSGSDSWDTHIFVGFSKTNRPDSAWTFYELNGNSFNDSTWSDYPIISINDNDVFITYNQVKDNVSWQIGFKQSVIWQLDKVSGYNSAATLPFTLWSNLKLDSVNYRNICPAKPQIAPFGNTMNFVSVRNVALSNDSVFLLTINNSQSSGNATLNSAVLKSNIPYGFPPNVPTKNFQELMTNDGRVLAAIYTNDKIYFGANTFNPTFNNSGVYLGTIENVNSAPIVTGKIIGASNVEYAYPSMCYLGNNSAADEKILYTFSQCYTDSFPGCAMLYKNNANQFSDIIVLKNGLSGIDALMDSTERWGDYSGTQRRYNQFGTAYMANSWGNTGSLKTWVSLINVADFPLSNTNFNNEEALAIYPVPAENIIICNFTLNSKSKVNIALFSLDGKIVQQLPFDYLKAGRQSIKINISELQQGNYILKGVADNGEVFSKQFLKK